jgi:hypothetical protein
VGSESERWNMVVVVVVVVVVMPEAIVKNAQAERKPEENYSSPV